MRHVFLLLVALAGSAVFVAPAAAQEPSDVTFEGEVAETSGSLGPGLIRITLTPSMDGVLRAELEDVRSLWVSAPRVITLEQRLSNKMYFWPPEPIVDGRFALLLSGPRVGSGPPVSVSIEGELVSSSELRGTLEHTKFGTNHTTWRATEPADTPPGAQDLIFDAFVEGGGRISVALTEDGLSVTSFDLQALSLDPCSPGETFSVRAFFDPGVDLDRAYAYVRDNASVRLVSVDVNQVTGPRASGTLNWSSLKIDDCIFHVRWQTEPFTTAQPTATPQPTATALPTPVEEPTGLPASGGGGARGVPSAGLAILAACLGAALAAVGLFRMRA